MEKKILFKRNVDNKVIFWYCLKHNNTIAYYYGDLNRILENRVCYVKTLEQADIKKIDVLIEREYKSQMAKGYKHYPSIDNEFVLHSTDYIDDIVDKTNTSIDYYIQSMKCQPFKFGKIVQCSSSQPKINGVRCTVFKDITTTDLFSSSNVSLLSREHISYKAKHLEEAMYDIINKITSEHGIEFPVLDGELYIPYTHVTTIAGAAKNEKNPYNKQLQFVIYDLAIDNYTDSQRQHILDNLQLPTHSNFSSAPIVYRCPTTIIHDDEAAIAHMELCIASGYEGSVVRNPHALYAFGKRPQTIQKLKKAKDSEFEVLDIIEYGDINQKVGYGCKCICRNDENGLTFEATVGGSTDGKTSIPYEIKRKIVENKELFIGKQATVKYFERTIHKLPFHANAVYIEGLEDLS